MADDLGLPLLGEVPLGPTLPSGGDEGRSVVIAAPETSAGRVLRKAARRVAAEISMRAENAAGGRDGSSTWT
jgi:ATP-binding protein involved in chromosome partitioning